MEVSKYNQMMSYLTRPRERFKDGYGPFEMKQGPQKGKFKLKFTSANPEGKAMYFDTKKEAQNYLDTRGEKLEKAKIKRQYDPEREKASKFLYNKKYRDLTTDEKAKVRTRIAATGKFTAKKAKDPLTKRQQGLILKEFPNADFSINKYGFTRGDGTYEKVLNFVKRGYKLRAFKPLSKPLQKAIIENFPEYKDWNFKTNLYGVPSGKGANMKLYDRIRTFVDDPKPFQFAFNLRSPEGWTMAQMYRAGDDKYEPIRNEREKIIGFKDKTGKTVRTYNIKNINKHPDFPEIQKYYNVAELSRTPVSKYENVSKLLPKGFDPDKILLNDLLQFIADKDGLTGINRAKRAIEIHHTMGVKNKATGSFQLLSSDKNKLADTIEQQIKKGNLGNEAKLIEKGIRIEVGGQKFGAKKLSPKGDFKQITSGVAQALEDPKFDFDGLAKALAVVGCGVDRTKVQTGGTPTQACIKAGAEKINNPSLIKGGAEARNAAQFLNRAYKVGRGILKFGVIPEAIFVAGESLVRMGMGDTLNEAFLRSTDYLRPGNQTREADRLKFERTVGKETADIIMRAQDYKKSIEQLNTAKSNLETNQAVLDQSDFGYTGNVDALERQKLDEQIIKLKEQNVKDKFQSEAVMDFATMKEAEAKDIASSNSAFAKAIQNARSAEVDDFEQLFVPEKKEKGVATPMLTMDDIADIAVTDTQLQREKDKLGGAPEFTKRNLFNFNRQTNEDYNKAVLDLIFTEGRQNLANRERLFGTQGTFGGQPLAGGGIAKLAGVDSGPPPEKGPTPQGLDFLLKRGR